MDSNDNKVIGAQIGRLREDDNPTYLKTGVSSLEYNQQCISLLRFLIGDDAFSPDFLITSIFAYYEWEMFKEAKKEPRL